MACHLVMALTVAGESREPLLVAQPGRQPAVVPQKVARGRFWPPRSLVAFRPSIYPTTVGQNIATRHFIRRCLQGLVRQQMDLFPARVRTREVQIRSAPVW